MYIELIRINKMIESKQENGIYECISKLPEPYYESIVPGNLYFASFLDKDLSDDVEIEGLYNRSWYFIPRQQFYDHFQKAIKGKTAIHKEDTEWNQILY